ncbi:hypothetical protein PCK1_002544 [Pneumocystis canis]|nr:hypothetical protein PCK1_002544 [Pneumocystis canis]
MEKKRKKTVDENTPISPSYISIYQNVSASIPFNHEIFDNTKTNLSKINEIIREDVPQDESQDLFEKHYMDIFTREFEDELDELRKYVIVSKS